MFRFWKKGDELKERLEVLHHYHSNLLTSIEAFNGESENNIINRNNLSDFPLLKWVDLNDKVRVRRRKNIFGNYLNFDTKMEKGGEFGAHFHEDMIESCEIIDGCVLDSLTNERFYSHDVMHYNKGVIHRPVALKDSILKVIFKT